MLRILIVLSFGLLSACGVSSGIDFKEEKLGQLLEGKTTYTEAVALLGKPVGVVRSSDGSMVATYQFRRISDSPTRALGYVPIVGGLLAAPFDPTPTTTAKSATLRFDPAGILRDWNGEQSGGAGMFASADVSAGERSLLLQGQPTPSIPLAAPSYFAGTTIAAPNAAIPRQSEASTTAMRQDGPATGQRIALIIGNSSYRQIGSLQNPAKDAHLVARNLRQLGYTLVGGGPQIDLDRRRFEKAIQDFGRAIPGAAVAVFYYAGHGMQVDGTNWLVPVDAEITPRKQDLPFHMVTADHVLLQMEGAGTLLNLMILDACRNNPLVDRGVRDARSGLAEMRAPTGSVIAYATQPGRVALDGDGGNSPYSAALADAMQDQSLDVFHLFNRVGLEVQRQTGGVQVPWVSNSPIRADLRLSAGG